jgi:hypothetical protein
MAHVGDEVYLWNGATRVVVCSLDTGEYTSEFPEAEWSYLKSGVPIRTPEAGLIHYLQPEANFELISRGRPTGQ